MISCYIANMSHLLRNILLKRSKFWGNKHYMLKLRIVSSLLLKLFSLVVLSFEGGSKLMNPKLKKTRAGPSQLPSQKFITFMDRSPSIVGLSRSLAIIMPPVIECTKKGSFEWIKTAQRDFESIKEMLCSTPIWALPNFELLFKVEYDASGIRSGAVLA